MNRLTSPYFGNYLHLEVFSISWRNEKFSIALKKIKCSKYWHLTDLKFLQNAKRFDLFFVLISNLNPRS